MEKNEKLEKTRAMRINRIMTLVIGTVALLIVYSIIVGKPPPPTAAVTIQSNILTSSATTVQQQHNQQQERRGSAAIRKELPSEAALVHTVHHLDVAVRKMKATGVFMEVDLAGLAATKRLQDATRLLLAKRYGKYEKPFRVRVDLTFQESNPTYKTLGAHDSFVIELAPADLLPHSVYTFLEICRTWPEKKGAFHRRANHVLQVLTKGKEIQHLAFQEYSASFPHVKGTVGYAGRPSGPHWYVSIMDNSKNHGPGSQGVKNPHEADSCFGKVIEGFDDVVVKRIRGDNKGDGPGMGFLNNPKDHILIDALTILVPNPNGNGSADDYVEWKPSPSTSELLQPA